MTLSLFFYIHQYSACNQSQQRTKPKQEKTRARFTRNEQQFSLGYRVRSTGPIPLNFFNHTVDYFLTHSKHDTSERSVIVLTSLKPQNCENVCCCRGEVFREHAEVRAQGTQQPGDTWESRNLL